jgi:osmotically-inducible protein OsmY
MLAWWVGGCRDVVNLLESMPAEWDGDEEISEALHLVLEADPRVRAEQIGIDVRNSRITLSGRVATKAESRQAEQDAWCLDCTGGVVNHIEVRG